MDVQRRHSIESISRRLAEVRAEGLPIVSASAGIGLVARSAEAAGVDLLSIQVTGLSRHLGVPTTTTLGNATNLTMEAFAEIENVVERTPLIGGIEATDGTRRRVERTIEQYASLGFDGISNFPTLGTMLTWAEVRKSVGEGIDREFELIRLARAAGLFTLAHAYTPEHAGALAEAGADVVVARCGPPAGGYVGPAREHVSVPESLQRVDEITTAVRAARHETFVLAHGGPFATPEDTRELYAETDVDGIHGESAIERIPLERHVASQVAAFKSQRIRTTA
jgi:predicted TIM-barrel enzyme